MTTRLTLSRLEELVRSDPELDADEALEYGDWLVLHPTGQARRRRRTWPVGLFHRRRSR
ncbi:MAG TPA: hypothetical protein VGP70_24700 [Actinomadura sp.]|jgi:hypothetical protein|nr:hypothetical protein [Actinomadura sp.]